MPDSILARLWLYTLRSKNRNAMKHKFPFIILCLLLSAGVGYFTATKAVEVRLGQAVNAQGIEIRDRIASQNQSRIRAVTTDRVASFSDAAEASVQAVVYVKVVKRAKISRPATIYDLLFGFAQTPQDQVGLGSGVIIRSDGYIVTNNHVIGGADEIEVTLENNTVYPAVIVGTDPATDIALLKVEATGLPVIPLGNSDELRLGDWVLAIGSPYDLRSTITAGIVSAKGRSLPNYDGQYRVESFIQTDAAVNPGNSGGALVNTCGELVGINTSIVSLTGSYAGYSFAVPVNIVSKIADDFINYGEVRRAILGISMSEIDAARAKALSLPEIGGVYVEGVTEGYPAARAGVKPGDVILELNLFPLRDTAAMLEQMSRLRPGEQAILTVWRAGRRMEIVVTL